MFKPKMMSSEVTYRSGVFTEEAVSTTGGLYIRNSVSNETYL